MDNKEEPNGCSIELQPLRQQGGSCIMKEPIVAATLICSTLFLDGALKNCTAQPVFNRKADSCPLILKQKIFFVKFLRYNIR